MKAIYAGKLYVALDTVGDKIELLPLTDDEEKISVDLSSPDLMLDPTDDEIREVRE